MSNLRGFKRKLKKYNVVFAKSVDNYKTKYEKALLEEIEKIKKTEPPKV